MNASTLTLGLDIGGTNVRAALVDGSRIVASSASSWPDKLMPDDEVAFIADQVFALLQKSGAGARAAGIALAALVNKDGMVVDWPNRRAWRGLRFRALLESKLDLPIVIEDDANAAAVAEWIYGAGRGHKNLLVMMAGTGVGAGVIVEGRLVRGANGWAGEIGHLTVVRDGPECACGKRGCLQVMASGRALEREAFRRGLDGAPRVTAAAESGERWAEEIITDCGRWIGLAAASAINLLDLDAVVIGGGLAALGAAWWDAVNQGLRSNIINRDHRSIALKRAVFSDTAGLIGAALLAGEAINGGAIGESA